MKDVIINGEAYEPIEHQSPKMPKRLASMLSIASVMGAGINFRVSSRKLPDSIDIIKEYELIQQKKSRLSRWEREQVENSFLYHYKKKQ